MSGGGEGCNSDAGGVGDTCEQDELDDRECGEMDVVLGARVACAA